MHVTEDDWKWGARILAERGGFMKYSTSFALRVHSPDPGLMKKLASTFGGKYSRVSGTLQWRLAGQRLITFLERTIPHLTPKLRETYGDEITGVAQAALDKLRARRERSRGTQAITRTRIPDPHTDENGKQHDDLFATSNLFGTIPAGPWSVDDAIIQLALSNDYADTGMLLEAETEKRAREFTRAVRLHITELEATRRGRLVLLSRPGMLS